MGLAEVVVVEVKRDFRCGDDRGGGDDDDGDDESNVDSGAKGSEC